jgi:hypothetical protein
MAVVTNESLEFVPMVNELGCCDDSRSESLKGAALLAAEILSCSIVGGNWYLPLLSMFSLKLAPFPSSETTLLSAKDLRGLFEWW